MATARRRQGKSQAKTDKPRLRTTALCRDYAHAWEPRDGGRDGKGWYRVLACLRCESERVESLNAYGEVEKRNYRYHEGYLLEGGPLTKEERGLIRLAHLEGVGGE